MKKNGYKVVITSLVPRPTGYNGKTGAMIRLVEILKRLGRLDGVKITVIFSDKYLFDYFCENAIDFEGIPVKSNLKFKSLIGLCLKSILIIAKSLFFLKMDFLESHDEKVIVYASSDLFWEVIPAFCFKTRKKNVKWIQTIYHIYPDWKTRPGNKATNFFGYYAQRFSFLLIKKKADKIILINSLVKDDLKKMGFSEKKMIVSSVGVDSEYFENIAKAESAYDGVFLARLSPSKGVLDLIEIWKNVCGELSGAKLAVIGGGSEKTKKILLKKIKEFDLEKNIDLLGFLEDEKAHPILKSGKVFLSPSHEEGWGIAIAEAMACALPVVSWDLPVYGEIFEKYTARIEENNIKCFAKKVVELLKNGDSRREMGQSGQNYIKKYSWDHVAEKEMEIIRS